MAVWEHELMRKMEGKTICLTGHRGIVCICSLPRDLLLLLLGHLSVIDFFSFRAICRCPRRAFYECRNLSQDQSQQKFPWVVFLSAADDSVPPALLTTGKLGDSFSRRVYDSPELSGARFLLSKHGSKRWLEACKRVLVSGNIEAPVPLPRPVVVSYVVEKGSNTILFVDCDQPPDRSRIKFGDPVEVARRLCVWPVTCFVLTL